MLPVLHHVGLAAADPAATLAFYQALWGGTVERLAGHTLWTLGDLRLAISPRTASEPTTWARGHHLAFALPATQKSDFLERLQHLGHAWEEVHGRTYLRDPDGFVLEMMWTEATADA